MITRIAHQDPPQGGMGLCTKLQTIPGAHPRARTTAVLRTCLAALPVLARNKDPNASTRRRVLRGQEKAQPTDLFMLIERSWTSHWGSTFKVIQT